MKQHLLDRLAEIEELLLEASSQGRQLAEQECFGEIESALSTLTDAVEYYVD